MTHILLQPYFFSIHSVTYTNILHNHHFDPTFLQFSLHPSPRGLQAFFFFFIDTLSHC